MPRFTKEEEMRREAMELAVRSGTLPAALIRDAGEILAFLKGKSDGKKTAKKK